MTPAAACSSTIRPSAAGTQRDIREGTDLARMLPFFGSLETARKFAEIGVAPVLSALPQRVAYVDFGGGQGVLAQAVRDFVNAAGRPCHATVVDANPRYLAQAAAAGIATVCANIEECDLRNIDLATLRLVLHYNARQQQAAILAGVAGSLARDGIAVTQIETGDPTVCALHTQIANLLSRESAPGYYWMTLEEYCELLRGAGFCDIAVVADDEPVDADVERALADAWQRFNGAAFRNAVLASQSAQVETMILERASFLRTARDLIAASPLTRRSFRLHYPIVTCRRAAAVGAA